ncbi:taurine dioxygenase [Minwuia sp.]|uniref:taurine dioxygenase n=1 Tax=Minwuia sp. TaxID=2493630 RepID=UPI003A8E18CC
MAQTERANDYRLIDVRPLEPALGAEIRGIDLGNGIADDAFAEVHRAFLEHQVIFFREQSELAPETQIAFARRFGDLHVHPAAPHLDGRPEVFVIHTHRESKVANGGGWHTDVSCDTEPPAATMLQIHTLPETGGDTLFASMYAAYDALSDPMKQMLQGLTAQHESEHVYRGRYSDRGVDDAGRVYPSATHPVVRTHPETGRKALYVNAGFTTRINELTSAESKNLLGFLFRHIESPFFQVRFRWSANDIALWDNRCLQHHALWDYWPHERKGHRVTIKGDRPYL